MGVDRMEGFAHFRTSAEWGAKGHTSGGVNLGWDPTTGRGGRGRMRLGLNATAHCVLPAARATTYVHVAFNTPSYVYTQFLEFRGQTHSHVGIFGLGDGSLYAYRYSTTFGVIPFLTTGVDTQVLGSTAPGVWRPSVWHQMQAKCTVSNGAGEVVIIMDGIEVLNLTGLDTYVAGNVATSMVGMGNNGGSSYVDYSDLLISNDVTGDNDGFLGDVAVYESTDPVDGFYLDWVRSSGAGTWSSHVDDNPKDDDTTQVRSDANGQRVSFFFPAVAASLGTPIAVKECVAYRKEEPSLGLLQLFTRSGGADVDGVTKPATESYKWDEQIHDVDPADSLPWSTAKVNATELGLHNVS
jgi:hypothetical protein